MKKTIFLKDCDDVDMANAAINLLQSHGIYAAIKQTDSILANPDKVHLQVEIDAYDQALTILESEGNKSKTGQTKATSSKHINQGKTKQNQPEAKKPKSKAKKRDFTNFQLKMLLILMGVVLLLFVLLWVL